MTSDLFSFTVMPGVDSVINFDTPPLRALDIVIDDRVGKYTRNQPTSSVNGVKAVNFQRLSSSERICREFTTLKVTPLNALLPKANMCPCDPQQRQILSCK